MAIDTSQFDNLSPAKKLLVILGLSALIVGLYWYVVHQGKAKTIKSLEKQLSDKQARLNEMTAVARNKPKFQEEVKKLNLRLSEIVQELPNSREIPDLLDKISNLGAVNGLEVIFIKPQKDRNKDFYAEVPIQIRVKGAYHHLGMFLDAISKLPRIINVGDITLGNPKEDPDSGNINLDVSILATTYRYLEKGG